MKTAALTQERRTTHPFFSLRWLGTTVLVLLAAAVMVRLGLWQLDRLEQRRARNALILQNASAPVLNLNNALLQGETRWEEKAFRLVEVSGVYLYEEEVLLLNQVWEGQPGYHLITPLHITGTDTVILVDRGWIPLNQGDENQRAAYRLPGEARLQGRLMPSQMEPRWGGGGDPVLPEGGRLTAWKWLNVERISRQISGRLLPVYMLALPDDSTSALPYRADTSIEVSEGSHLSYALQWFSFALILLAGYPFYVRKHLSESA
ncbi:MULTISPECIES: SURF1 family protein [Anaerolinea]|uniref:SURF1 family protein n=1 Tax=Anaerolinea TaxID=233189 RepID=UPI00260754BF|nr:SURF1 family protein [Anaerolinea thermophila]